MIRLFGIGCIVAVMGALGFFAITNYHSYTKERTERIRERTLQFDIATTLWRYGIIEEVHRDTHSLLVRITSNIIPGAQNRLILVRTDSATTLARQELVGDGNIYSALTAPTPIAFETLVSGTHVALLLFNISEQEIIYARAVIVGNPL